MIDKPTRVTPTSATLLDVTITNKNYIITTHDVIPQVIADLISVTVNVTKPKRQPVKRTFRHLGGYCKLKLCSLLLKNSHYINKILFTDDVNKQVGLFTEVFIKCLDACAPIVTKEIKRPFAPWMNDDFRRAINIRNNAQSNLKAGRHNSRLQELYKKEKKHVRTLISKTKADYYHARINNCRGNSSATWKVITDLIPCQKRNSNSYNFDNMSYEAEEFKMFFSNIGKATYERTQLSFRDPHNRTVNNSNPALREGACFRPEPVDTDTVMLTIKSLKETKAVGSDGIPLWFLKDALPVIISYLTCIINTSLATGIFPTA